MNRFAEIILGDGMLCACPFEDQEVPDFGAVCVVSIDEVSEFGRFLGIRKRLAGRDATYFGKFERVADEEDLMKLAGNEEAAARVRGILLKWVTEERRLLYTLRIRFTVRRERLYLTLDAADTESFQSIFETLQKRFQTQVSARFVSSRAMSGEIGGTGVCGRELCCSNGTCEYARVDVKMAKQQSIPLHDSVASGLCGRLKCCISYEV